MNCRQKQMPTFHIEQFGCRATQADAAAIERQLRAQGHTVAKNPAASEIVVINTCTVTASADAQARDAIRKIHAHNPKAKIIATGCYAQRAPEELAALPGVTHVVGNSHKPEIPALIAKIAPPNSIAVPAGFVSMHALAATTLWSSPKILTGNIFDRAELLPAPVLGGESNHTRPTLKIQDGCNSRCSYCVIPFVRGKSRSLPPNEVVEEIRRLSTDGYKEVVLSGINLGTYGRDLQPRVEFADLLRRILDETDIARFRISSIEPLDVTQELIALFASTPRIAQHFHMPLQSASDRILAAMHRWYRAEHYARRVEFIREHLPHAAIGADVITGFPGESAEDHAATVEFIERLPFTYLHVFSYSMRPGTKAAARSNQIPGATIHSRARELRALAEKKSAAFRESQLNTTQEVLTLRHTRAENSSSTLDPIAPPNWTPAITSNYLQIRLAGTFPPNCLLRIKIARHENGVLHAHPETTPNFAVHRAASHR
jgi:threonylcarbamoyladenosine tRNA methylthiotransferase MtaB